MAKNDKTENKGLTFPVNQATLAGLVVRETFNDKQNRANVTLLVNTGKEPKFVNVLISGKERYANFKNNFEAALKELGTNEKGQVKPCMFVTGQAYFSSNTPEGAQSAHQNYTLIATGNLKENTESFQLTSNKVELDQFRSEYNSQNPSINHVSIRGRLTANPILIEGKNGPFYKMSIAHHYNVNDQETKTMFANVVVPSSLMDQMKQANPEKGTAILLSGKIQPVTYPKGEETVHSFNIVTTALQRDLTNTTTVKKAAESIDKVAAVVNKKERLQEAEVQKGGLKK